MSEMVAMYRGRHASELTREELIVAYTNVCQELTRMRQQQIDDADIEREFELTRRAISRMA